MERWIREKYPADFVPRFVLVAADGGREKERYGEKNWHCVALFEFGSKLPKSKQNGFEKLDEEKKNRKIIAGILSFCYYRRDSCNRPQNKSA